MWENEDSFAVAALCFVVLVVVAEYAQHGEVESAVAWIMMWLPDAVTGARVVRVAKCWFLGVIVAKYGRAAVAPWIS